MTTTTRQVAGGPKSQPLSHDPPQQQVLDEFLALGTGRWSRVYGSWGSIAHGPSGGIYSSFLRAAKAQKAVTHLGWDIMYETAGPTFVRQMRGGRRVTRYERPGADGVEALVHVRFIPNRHVQLDVSEEFRLWFGLFNLPDQRNQYLLDESGNEEEAVRITDTSVDVLTALIRRYQAARRLHFAFFVDSKVIGAKHLDGHESDWEMRDSSTFLAYNVGDLGISAPGQRFSRLVGKRILSPPPRKASGVWPFEPPQRFEKFIIATNDVGKPTEASADPKGLDTREGPPFLTSVFFRRSVLGKYYDRPERYSVEDGYLRCGGLWGMPIDNDSSDYVSVFLGDLGRHLPFAEQTHWKSHNIPPDGPISATAFGRSFLGQPVSPTALDLRFGKKYTETNRTWERCFGWPLFRPLSAEDAHVLSKLHIPFEDSQSEFDEQVLHLAKLLVDSLNEKAIVKIVGIGPRDERSLGKLERFLKQGQSSDTDSIMSALRTIQMLRSKGSAHLKGTEYQQARARAPRDRRRWMESLLNGALLSLSRLSDFAVVSAV